MITFSFIFVLHGVPTCFGIRVVHCTSVCGNKAVALWLQSHPVCEAPMATDIYPPPCCRGTCINERWMSCLAWAYTPSLWWTSIMRPSALQLNTPVQVRVGNDVQLWPKGRKTASFEGGYVVDVKYGAVHLSSITTAFSVIVLKLVVLWRASFLLDLMWTNVSQEYKNKWPFRYCGRYEIVASVQVLTCAPITLISPPFPLSPHPLST